MRLTLICFSGTDEVEIGLMQSFYSIDEGSGEAEVCIQVISGEISGRNISVNYTTIDGSAKGN